ncbi:TIGR04211 family SH3 domain-containing protein [Candidatus Pseudothioglobus singularis]|nr:TIGR04211 family SH3 domain-containing protein [Candidatus Pseudothioglobus singularis]MDB4847192.1 TIGR04211 family SH3 domain-containing protein [Candidatus Pseudothioglobus singularis]
MIKFISLLLALMLLTLRVSAESYVYITDQLDLPIRSDKSFGNNIIRLLPSGTELSLLQSTEDGWAQIQFDDTIGWIKSFYLSPEPSAREKLKKLTRTYNANKLLISKLSGEKEELEGQLLSVKQENTDLIVQSSKSQAEKEHIEQIYQDALKLEHENEKLIQEKLQLKAELQLSVNNTQIQKDTSSRNWFIVGAIVLFFGMIIGFIVPGLLNRRRY